MWYKPCIKTTKRRLKKIKIKKIFYVIFGCVFLTIGAIGSVVPLLPAFPFLMLAAVCFAKSSERLHLWFLETKLYKKNLESFFEGKGMFCKTKVKIMIFVTLTMSIGFIMMNNMPHLRIVLAIVWLFHVLYFAFKVKTIHVDDAWEIKNNSFNNIVLLRTDYQISTRTYLNKMTNIYFLLQFII